MVFAALDQVPSDLHINAIVLGVLSFLVAILMLIDLADPMARLISDTTQTENISINDTSIVQGSPTMHENKEETAVVKPTVVTINGHLPNSNNQNHQNISSRNLNHNEIITQSPKTQILSSESIQQHQYVHNDQIFVQDQIDNITRNGNYHRNNTDEIEFVHAKILPGAQQPVFEKILLPEKQRPTWKVIPDPNVSNSPRTEYLQTSVAPSEYLPTYSQEPYRRTSTHRQYHHNSAYDYDYSPPKTPEIDTRNRYSYDGKRLMVIRDYSKNNIRNVSGTMMSNRSQEDTARYSGRSRSSRQCRYDEVDEEIYDRRMAAVSTIQPGFVANAAKLWDKRAKQPDDFNTIV